MLWECFSPGVAGEAGAEDGVAHGNGDVVVMQPAVDPVVRHDIRPIRDGTTCTTTTYYYQQIYINLRHFNQSAHTLSKATLGELNVQRMRSSFLSKRFYILSFFLYRHRSMGLESGHNSNLEKKCFKSL